IGCLYVDLHHPGPTGLDRELGAVLLSREADRRRLDAHRQVLGHDRDVDTFVREVLGYREDARVVVTEAEARRQRVGVGVVELHAERATRIPNGDRAVEAAVLDTQLVESAERGPGEVPELGMVSFGLELRDHHDGYDD